MSQSSTPPEPPLNRTQNFSPHEMLGSAMLRNLLNSGIIVFEDWQALANDVREQVIGIADIDQLLARLSELSLLTTYQVGRIRMGRLFGLVLGNYRILDRIGAGGDGGSVSGRASALAAVGGDQGAFQYLGGRPALAVALSR
jgi:hypothetical protein